MFLVWTIGLAISNRANATNSMRSAESAAIVADFDHWVPPRAVGGSQWHEQQHETGTDRPRDCGGPILWSWTSGRNLSLDLVRLRCNTAYAAYDVEDNYAGQIEDVHLPASGPNYARVYDDGTAAQVVWRQRNVMLALNLTCGRADPTPCVEDARELARAVDQVGANVLKADPAPTNGTGYLLAPIVVWLALVAPVRMFQLIRQQRWSSINAPPRYIDITTTLRSAKRRRFARLLLWWVASLLGVISMLAVTDTLLSVKGEYALPGLICAALACVSFLFGRRIDGSRKRKPRAHRRDLGRRGRTGIALSWWSATLTATALPTYVFIALAGAVARQVTLDRLYYTLDESRRETSAIGTIRWIFDTVAIGYRNDLSVAIVLALLPTLAFAYLLRTMGQRLRAADAKALLSVDNRPPFLYLRSFDEDKLKIAAPAVRTGPLERLIPWRRRSFERVLVGALSKHGPVIAVSDPRARLPQIGAARTTLPHDMWHQQVAQMAHDSLAVVVGGTPSEVREGLGYELSMLAATPTPRLLVVQAPYRKRELARRWHKFVRQACHLPLFAPLAEPWVQEGALVVSHDRARGWTAWGSTKRTDRSYALAIDAALNEQIPIWLGAYLSAHSAPPPM
jgi:hypothetical protein